MYSTKNLLNQMAKKLVVYMKPISVKMEEIYNNPGLIHITENIVNKMDLNGILSFRLVSKSLNEIACDYLSQKYLGIPYSQECWKKLIVFMMLHQKIQITKTNEKLHFSCEIATRLRMTKEM